MIVSFPISLDKQVPSCAYCCAKLLSLAVDVLSRADYRRKKSDSHRLRCPGGATASDCFGLNPNECIHSWCGFSAALCSDSSFFLPVLIARIVRIRRLIVSHRSERTIEEGLITSVLVLHSQPPVCPQVHPLRAWRVCVEDRKDVVALEPFQDALCAACRPITAGAPLAFIHKLIAPPASVRPERRNHVWSYDFVSTRTHDGRSVRLLNLIDEHTRESLLVRAERRWSTASVISALADVMVMKGVPEHLRSDNGPEFVAKDLRKWLAKTGAKTLYIEPGSPWENGYCESFNSKLRDEFLNGEIFYSIKELRVLAERWRVHYNTIRPHSSLGYRSPAPEARLTNSMGYGEVETATRFPLLHTPDGGYGSGRRWSSHDTTDDYRRLDVRYMQRQGLLQGRSTGSLQWSSRGETTGNIDFRAEADRVVLSYRSRERGKDWESLEYAVSLGADALQLRRHSHLVSLPSSWLRTANGDPVRRTHLRLQEVLQTRLPESAADAH